MTTTTARHLSPALAGGDILRAEIEAVSERCLVLLTPKKPEDGDLTELHLNLPDMWDGLAYRWGRTVTEPIIDAVLAVLEGDLGPIRLEWQVVNPKHWVSRSARHNGGAYHLNITVLGEYLPKEA